MLKYISLDSMDLLCIYFIWLSANLVYDSQC